MYHKVAALNPRSNVLGHYVSPAAFDRQMGALQAMGFSSVPLGHFRDALKVKRPVVITFDDGYQNFYDHALPSLKKRGLAATVFLVSGQIGGTNEWDAKLGDVEERLMTAEMIASARKEGIEFGSHTSNHANLTKVDADTAWREICDSRCDLEERLGEPVSTFAYPYGAENSEVREMVSKAGYRFACSTRKGANDSTTDPFALKRINIRRDTGLPVFVMKIWRGLRLDR
jgi:peptidoglycan/xylan/chitin deacetylase (PgdA/CDA1 family)